MKKILLGTTALVAATAVSAGVAKADLSVSGWNTFGIGVGDVEIDAVDSAATPTGEATGDIDIYENGEIYFHGSTDMDNGLSVSWDVQLETENGGTNFIDENYFTISGDFGSVLIGQENLPNYKMHYSGGIWVGNAGISSPSYTQFTGSPGGLSYFHSGFMNDTAPVGNDADMISYYSPRMNGFQVGLGWMPDSDQNDGGRDGTEEFEDTFSAGLNYVTDMDGTSIAASLGYTNSDVNGNGTAAADQNSEVSTFQAGLHVGFGGVTLGASYMEQTDDDNVRSAGDTENYLLGVTYAAGPHSIGLTGIWSEAEETIGNPNDTEGTAYMLAHDYSLGGGVSLTSAVIFIDVDDELGSRYDADGYSGMVMLNAGF